MPYKDPIRRKEYAAQHYKDNLSDYALRNETNRRTLRKTVDDLKRGPCTDCARLYHPCQMQFDHIGTDKVAGISEMIRGKGIKAVMAEIAKCELVCANCHALRTHDRATGKR